MNHGKLTGRYILGRDEEKGGKNRMDRGTWNGARSEEGSGTERQDGVVRGISHDKLTGR